MKRIRVIVTGSRNWPKSQVVHDALDQVVRENPGCRITVVHGACKTGADMHASMWALAARHALRPVDEEPHPANWDVHHKAAGPLRNQLMVDLGADLVLAFLLGDSRGTRDCIRRARAAAIPVREVTP